MNDITLRDLLRFIDDDMKLNIQMTDRNGDVCSVSGFVRDLVVMLGEETLNRKVDIMMQTVLHEVCISVFQEMNAENMQDVKLPPLYEALKEYPAIARRLQENGVMTTEELISMTEEELKAIGHIGSTAVCRIRTALAKNGLHLKGEEL